MLAPKNLLDSPSVVKVESLKKRSLWGYKGDDWVEFVRIIVSEPKALPKVRDMCSIRYPLELAYLFLCHITPIRTGRMQF